MRQRKQRQQERLESIVCRLKSGLCGDCSRSFRSEAMHFDHRPDEVKVFHISALVYRACSVEKLLLEIGKCDLVCVGCHRARTASRVIRMDRYSCKSHPAHVVSCRMCGIADRRRTRSSVLRRKVSDLKKDRPCSDCGTSFDPLLMDWDHRPEETKLIDIASAVSGGWRFDKIEAEMSKCDLVCCWCHVERTSSRQEGGVLSRTG